MDASVKNLMNLSTSKTFKESEYVCFEGQPGNELYIILKGSVGVYIGSPIGTQIQVAVIRSGDFFGEMAVFDSLPRSASCIALEDTVCVAVNKEMLPDFIERCPDITAKLLENMSNRIRRLNDELYKTEKYISSVDEPDFKLPEHYDFSHVVEEPPHSSSFIEPLSCVCPICGKPIIVTQVKRNSLVLAKIDQDCRRSYKDCEPMWYDVWGCPYCHYSNHYLKFFNVLPINVDVIKRLLKEKQDPVIERTKFLKTPFDHIFLKYIQAIYINEIVCPREHLLTGMLWLNLYWLFCDAADDKMKIYCAEKAVNALLKAFKKAAKTIPDEYSRQSIAMSLAHLLAEIGRKEEAVAYCDKAAEFSDAMIKVRALRFKEQLMRKELHI